jgi:hypothetical protein
MPEAECVERCRPRRKQVSRLDASSFIALVLSIAYMSTRRRRRRIVVIAEGLDESGLEYRFDVSRGQLRLVGKCDVVPLIESRGPLEQHERFIGAWA